VCGISFGGASRLIRTGGAIVICEKRFIAKTTIQRGETWKLGRHRLMCGDSTDRNIVQQFIGSEKVDMILTDPPYNMSYSGGGCFNTEHLQRRIAKIIDFDAHNIAFYTEMDIPSVYIFTSKSLVRDYLNIFDGYNNTILVWCKTNPTPFVDASFLPNLLAAKRSI